MSHYFKNDNKIKDAPREINFNFKGISFIFNTNDGVFSKSAVDEGSKLLISTVLDNKASNIPSSIVELGGGYGPITIVLAKIFSQSKDNICATMYEINERAAELAKKNIIYNKLGGVNILVDDLNALDEITACDLCVTNPPIRAGKNTVWHFFELAHGALSSGGSFYAVVRKAQGAASAKKRIKELFGNCETVARGGGYHVLFARR